MRRSVSTAAQTGGQPWEPKNYDGKYEGPMTMRKGLTKSKNMISIRILQKIGAKYGQEYTTRFGFDFRQKSSFPDVGTRCRCGNTVTDGRSLFGIRQRRLQDQSIPDHEK